MDRNEQNAAKKLEGVFSLGYGVVPRSVMLQGELSAEAKALYAYYCVLSGNQGGYQSSPREELILKSIHISHTRFIKHRKTLTEQGLISFIQPKRETGKPVFETSRFLIVKSPRTNDPLSSLPQDAPLNALAAVQEGIFSEGFGLVPKMVLFDANLSVEAKAAYVFLCVFANASTCGIRSANPSAALLQDKLMTRKRVQHAMSELIDAGYIRRERLHNGAYAGMIYILNYEINQNGQASRFDTAKAFPQKVQNDTTKDNAQGVLNDTAENTLKNPTASAFSQEDTSALPKVQNDTAKRVLQQRQFETFQNETAHFETAENETHYTNSKGINKNANKYIRPVNPINKGRQTDESCAHANTEDDFEIGRLEAAKQIDAEILAQEYGSDALNAIVLLLADIYAADNGKLRINGRDYPIRQVAQVYRTLKAHHIEYVLDKFKQQREVVNLQSYLYSCLYNAAISCDLEIFKMGRL